MVCGDLLPDLRSELIELAREERLEQAGVGRESDFHIDHDVRGDRIFWLTRQRSVQRRLLDRLEELRLDLNRELFLGLFEFEGHLAHFPPGTFYRRHLDSFRGAANRIVSVTIYLNENWQLGDGGELVLYRPDSDIEMARIEPRAGTIALFLSEEIPHEVLPSRIHRASIAGWFRLNNTTASYIDPPR
ncbi:2OG-Fe(II) oxygenase [Wenzhouxiangella sp. AB-CW3]|nr:2OG-Fe(II) oxygenase [Wenzhouxiangella sp. AB-CW3]